MLQTDYLVIGAGAASMAFIDTLMHEQPAASIIIVDKHGAPGGHWNDAYDFVRLHQPSLLYGVASTQLEGNWAKLLLKGGTLPWTHRASKLEILDYYQRLMNQWTASGRVHYFPKCMYDFEKSNEGNHSFHTLDGSQTYNVKVAVKLVNGILGECQVPSTTPPTFPVDESIHLLTPNHVYDKFHNSTSKRSSSYFSFSRTATKTAGKYVVLGCGKTAMDTVVYLQRNGIDDISWIIPSDVWILRRTGAGGPWSWGAALLEHDLDANKAALSLEQEGALTRIDTNIMPTKFRFPVVGNDEMKLLSNVKNIIRQGRVTSIAKGGKVSFERGDDIVFDDKDTFFVHCMSPGPFNGNTIPSPFPNDKTINLPLLYAPPVPMSMSSIAVLESRRRNGTLDLEFGRKLCKCLDDDGKDTTENDVLKQLISSYNLTGKDDVTMHLANQMAPLKTLACFLAVFDKDPMIGYEWLSGNRLSFFSIPGFKGEVYETVLTMMEKEEPLGLSQQEVEMLSLVAEKLEPLKGK